MHVRTHTSRYALHMCTNTSPPLHIHTNSSVKVSLKMKLLISHLLPGLSVMTVDNSGRREVEK